MHIDLVTGGAGGLVQRTACANSLTHSPTRTNYRRPGLVHWYGALVWYIGMPQAFQHRLCIAGGDDKAPWPVLFALRSLSLR